MMMMLRFSMIAAASLCLLGCDKTTQATGDISAITNAPGAAAAAAPATSGEMITTASGLK